MARSTLYIYMVVQAFILKTQMSNFNLLVYYDGRIVGETSHTYEGAKLRIVPVSGLDEE